VEEHRIPLHVRVDRIPCVCSACIESNSRKKVSVFLFAWLPCKSDSIMSVVSRVSAFPSLGGWTQSNGYGWLVPQICKSSDAWLVIWITSIGRVNCMSWEGRKARSSIQWGREGFIPPPDLDSIQCLYDHHSMPCLCGCGPFLPVVSYGCHLLLLRMDFLACLSVCIASTVIA
jgi:hypothetical protein